MSGKASLLIALATSAALPAIAGAAISYSVAASTYSENFNGLPIDSRSNATIESGAVFPEMDYTDGWQDDVDYLTSAEDDVSVQGWHVFHPISPAAENGFNGNQRFRMGTGANTGAFWGFATGGASDAEKALGSVGSTTTATDGAGMFIGLQLINNTGQTLTSFTLTYDGEQWRDGQSTGPETLAFAYSTQATDATGPEPWHSGTTYNAVTQLDFTSPVFAGTSSGGTAVNGNVAGRQADISYTVTGINWAPGGELWLRWRDAQLASNADDGLAVDNVRFEAFVPEPTGLTVLALGGLGLLARRRR